MDWIQWLTLMVPYSAFFFLVDSAVVWRVVSWFNTPISYTGILPIRGSSYILSILNEQVGKGAMGLYLFRRYGVPGWEVGSSMIFIMFCEFFYLLFWATIGWTMRRDDLPEVFGLIPVIAVGAAVFLAGWIYFFRRGEAPAPADPEEGAPVALDDVHGHGCGGVCSRGAEERETADRESAAGRDDGEAREYDACSRLLLCWTVSFEIRVPRTTLVGWHTLTTDD